MHSLLLEHIPIRISTRRAVPRLRKIAPKEATALEDISVSTGHPGPEGAG